MENEKNELIESMDLMQEELSQLKEELRVAKQDKLMAASKFEHLRDSFNAYKASMAIREDPFVLRLALDQSRKDFSKVAQEVVNKPILRFDL